MQINRITAMPVPIWTEKFDETGVVAVGWCPSGSGGALGGRSLRNPGECGGIWSSRRVQG